MASLTALTVDEMRQGLLQGDFSAVELCESHLKRIEETNPVLNSFITVSGDQARKQAQAADEALKKDKNATPLLTGIPIAIKDLLVTEGIETTCGSKILKGFVPPYDCTAVRRIKRHGGVILGKTNLDEFGMGSSNENSAYGPVRNPRNLSRVPGGSSGGSAAAVCAGQAPLALGTDTGGSIREPASFSGIYGLKPTYGRVSRYGMVAYASSLDQIGPMARNVSDLASLLTSISGWDERDSSSMNVPAGEYMAEVRQGVANGLKGIRFGIPKEYFVPGMSPAVETAVKGLVPLIEKLGGKIVEVSLPHTEHALSVYYILAPAEASSNLARYDGVRYGVREKGASLGEMYENTRAGGFGPEVQRRILIGTYVLSAGYYDAFYRKAQQVRTLLIDDFRAAFANMCDVIFAPVAPTTAFALGEKTESPLSMYLADIFTIPVNLAGLPGLALPIGVDGDSLPIGAQLIGAPFTEPLLLRAAAALEADLHFDTKTFARAALPAK